MVHGDDFTAVCNESGARWLEDMMKQHFEIKTKVLGKGRDPEIVVLNRTITMDPSGVSVASDAPHWNRPGASASPKPRRYTLPIKPSPPPPVARASRPAAARTLHTT